MKKVILPLIGIFAAGNISLHAQSSGFTYQGKLHDNGAPADGIYDLRFTIYDAVTNGNVVSVSQTNSAIAVSNGLFTTQLNFGANVFNGLSRWLDIGVRTNGDAGPHVSLHPRQALTSTPYAIRAANATTATSVTGNISASQLSGTIPSNLIGTGTITATMLANGAVTTMNLANGAVSADKLGATADTLLSVTFTNPSPATGDSFGAALATLGTNRVLIGAARDNGGIGGAYMFSATGTLITTFNNPTPAAQDQFGISIAASSLNRVLIGAAFDDTGATDAGAAYLFGTNGALITTFTNPSPAAGEGFGFTVAAVGNGFVIIGAPLDGTGASRAGSAYLFATNGALITTFNNPTPEADELFGRAVTAVGNDHVLIGADREAGFGGAAYLFNTNGTLVTTIANPSPATLDQFGSAVSAVGSNHILIGANGDDTGGAGSGAAYLFNTNGTLITVFSDPSPEHNEYFGIAVAAIGNDRVLIGADLEGQENFGAAYLFSTNGALLATFVNPTPVADDFFGGAIAALGTDRVLVGASDDDAGTTNAGAAYLFTFGEPYVHLVDGSIKTSTLADGSVTSAKISDVDASKITSGAINDARLSTNVARLNANQTFSGTNTFTKNVGIGTTTPADQLQIGTTSTAADQYISLKSAGGNLYRTGIKFRHFNDTGGFNIEDSEVNTENGLHFIRYPFGAPSTAMFIERSTGEVGIGTTSPASTLHVIGVVTATVFNPTSDRNAKENVTFLDSREVLEKVARLPISQWNFKGEQGAKHVGPMAQDFHAAFGLGTDDKHIATVDADGVALAAIQGLNQKLEQKLQEQNAALRKQNEELEKRLRALEERLNLPLK